MFFMGFLEFVYGMIRFSIDRTSLQSKRICSGKTFFSVSLNVLFFFSFLSNARLECPTSPEAIGDMGTNDFLEKEGHEHLSHDFINGTTNGNVEAARRLAKRLYHLDRFKRSDVAKHLGKKYALVFCLNGYLYCTA